MPARSLHISGKVQNVCFRAETTQMARELGVCGWVRNTKQGGVEVYAEGSNDALEALEKWCHRGPTAAHVTEVNSKEVPQQHMAEFTIVH